MPSLFESSGQNKQQKALTAAETQDVTLGNTEAAKNLPQAASALQGPLSFFQSLLSGNRSTVMNTLEAPISSLTSQYATSAKSSEEFAPRGGGRAAALEEAPSTEAGQIEQLVAGAEAEGAQGVASIADMLGNLGLGEIGVASSTAANTANQLQSSIENQQQQQQQAGAAVGGLVSLLAGL